MQGAYTDSRRKRVAVHFRQIDVHQRQIDGVLFDLLKLLVTIACLAHSVALWLQDAAGQELPLTSVLDMRNLDTEPCLCSASC